MGPKQKCFVKLQEGLTTHEIDNLTNGIRNVLTDRTIIVLRADIVEDSLHSFKVIFEVFVAVIAIIALIIAFFLLMISTTQNINEAIWEYGVLRSMGLTKLQGRRIFMYEAFMIVLTACILGFIVGLMVAAMVTAQFYLFIEQDIDIEWPGYLLTGMFFLSMVTTFVAVYLPIEKVNKTQIAVVLKGSAS